VIYNGEECLDYSDAAVYAHISRDTVIKAITIGVFIPVRVNGQSKKYILKWELDAVMDRPVASRRTAEYLNAIRVKRNAPGLHTAAAEQEFSVDGTPEYITSSELRLILMEYGLRFEQVLAAKLQEQSVLFVRQIRELKGSLSGMLSLVIQTNRTPDGSAMLNNIVAELRNANQQRMADPDAPLSPSVQSMIEAFMPDIEERDELVAMGEELRRNMSGGGEGDGRISTDSVRH